MPTNMHTFTMDLVSPCIYIGNRPFSVSTPVLWNSLPFEIRKIDTLAMFKSVVKTCLFLE